MSSVRTHVGFFVFGGVWAERFEQERDPAWRWQLRERLIVRVMARIDYGD